LEEGHRETRIPPALKNVKIEFAIVM